LRVVTPRPLIFISAASRELHSARQLVANTLTFLGYQPVWQDIFGTESGDLRAMLRKQIDQCKGVVQLIGQCYGAEPPTADEEFGRVSYTQYEALYARKRGKKVWYLFIDESFPRKPCEAEPEELQKLQADYRRGLQSDTHVFHSLTTTEGLEASVLKLRDDLTRLRRGVKQWSAGVAALLIVILALVIWQLRGQAEMKAEMAKLLRQGIMEYPRIEAQVRGSGIMEYPRIEAQVRGSGITEYPHVEAQVRRSQPEKDQVALQERIYAELGKQFGVDPKILREKLPRFADELRHTPNANAYERANASYVANDYAEAERLALQAADEAQKLNPSKPKNTIQAFELAGLSAQKRIEYARAMEHFREAEKLTDRDRNPEDWAEVQFVIANLLIDQGQYGNAENILRSVVGVRNHVLGSEHPDTLLSRNDLANIFFGQGKYAEAEAEYRLILKLYEKVLSPEHPDTLRSRHNLAAALDEQGKYAEAEAQDRDVIKLREKVLGPEHPETLQSRNNLAMALDDQGKYAEAEAQDRDVIKIEEKLLGPEHPETLGSRATVARALNGQAKYAEAEAQFRDVIKIQEKVEGPQHPSTLDSCYYFASGLKRQNKLQEAKEFARRAAEGAHKVLGPNHPSTQKYEKLLAELQAKP
jgi:tetratricopeptide (TPR) repeat protein